MERGINFIGCLLYEDMVRPMEMSIENIERLIVNRVSSISRTEEWGPMIKQVNLIV